MNLSTLLNGCLPERGDCADGMILLMCGCRSIIFDRVVLWCRRDVDCSSRDGSGNGVSRMRILNDYL